MAVEVEHVGITKHALESAVRRCPELASYPEPVNQVYKEIVSALADGRKSKSRPAWLGRDSRKVNTRGPGRRGKQRFVWNEAQTRCYVLIERTGRKDGKKMWLCLTVLIPIVRNYG